MGPTAVLVRSLLLYAPDIHHGPQNQITKSNALRHRMKNHVYKQVPGTRYHSYSSGLEYKRRLLFISDSNWCLYYRLGVAFPFLGYCWSRPYNCCAVLGTGSQSVPGTSAIKSVLDTGLHLYVYEYLLVLVFVQAQHQTI